MLLQSMRLRGVPSSPSITGSFARRCRDIRASLSCRSEAGPVLVKTTFKLAPMPLQFGDWVSVIGNSPALGEWNDKAAQPMKWTPGDVWVCEVDLPSE